jgi:hypothetical protein
MTTPTLLTLGSLFDFLKKTEPTAELQKETSQVFVLRKTDNIELALFFKIIANGELMQIVSYLPVKVSNDRFQDVARLLSAINNDLDVPGFSLNESSNLIFYRVVVPFYQKKLNQDLIKQYLNVSVNAAQAFINVINAVSSGQMTYDELLQKQAQC